MIIQWNVVDEMTNQEKASAMRVNGCREGIITQGYGYGI